MPTHERRRPPISVRRAFGLAFDLALRRDPVHSLVAPMLLRAPWIMALVLLPSAESEDASPAVLGLTSAALIGDFVTLMVVGAMLRVRARSVYGLPPDTRPAPVADCYATGARRVPRLLVTEMVRNLVLALAASVIVLPTAFSRFRPESAVEDLGRNLALMAGAILLAIPSLFVVYRLGVATEAVVLDEPHLANAFQSSFRMMRGHLERWLELVLASGALVIVPALAVAALTVAMPSLSGTPGLALFWLTVVAVWPVIQYMWTFFYLRLREISGPLATVDQPPQGETQVVAEAVGGAAPHLELVPPPRTDVSDTNT